MQFPTYLCDNLYKKIVSPSNASDLYSLWNVISFNSLVNDTLNVLQKKICTIIK